MEGNILSKESMVFLWELLGIVRQTIKLSLIEMLLLEISKLEARIGQSSEHEALIFWKVKKVVRLMAILHIDCCPGKQKVLTRVGSGLSPNS